MVSEQELRQQFEALLGQRAPRSLNYRDLAQRLNDAEQAFSIRLSVYGFIMHLIESYGVKALYSNVISSSDALKAFVDESRNRRDSMPELMLGAGEYVDGVMKTMPDMDTALSRLEQMSRPSVLYVLFKSSGEGALVERYREEFTDNMKRYPSMLDKLPEAYRKAVEND